MAKVGKEQWKESSQHRTAARSHKSKPAGFEIPHTPSRVTVPLTRKQLSQPSPPLRKDMLKNTASRLRHASEWQTLLEDELGVVVFAMGYGVHYFRGRRIIRTVAEYALVEAEIVLG